MFSEFSDSKDFSSYFDKIDSFDVDSLEDKKQDSSKILIGTIIKIDDKHVWVDTGDKEDGRILKDEFKYDGKLIDLKKGDQVKVCREFSYDGSGSVFSHHRARREMVWPDLEKAWMNKTNIDGKVVSSVQGGFLVEIMNAVVFLPEKQLDSSVNTKNLIGQTMKFRITKMDRYKSSVVISRERAFDLEEDALLQIGEIVNGVVTELSPEQIFLKYKDSSLIMNVKDYLWEKVEDIESILSIGQEIRVKILGHDSSSNTFKVGHKQLLSDPWVETVQYAGVATGMLLNARVQKVEKSGVTMMLDTKPALIGYLPAEESVWTRKSLILNDAWQLDQACTVVVMSVDKRKHMIMLSAKKASSNPLEDFIKKNKVNDVLKGKAVEVSHQGTVVEFPASEGSSQSAVEGVIPGVACELDSEVEVAIVSIDVENYNLSLRLKNGTNPYEFEAWKYVKVGSVMTCTIKKIEDNAIFVTDTDGVDGIIRQADLNEGMVLADFHVDQSITATVIGKDDKQMKVILSDVRV